MNDALGSMYIQGFGMYNSDDISYSAVYFGWLFSKSTVQLTLACLIPGFVFILVFTSLSNFLLYFNIALHKV